MAFLGTTIAQPSYRVRALRQRTLIRASVSSDSLPAQDAVVRNVSQFGLGLSTKGVTPRVNETITICFANGICVAGCVMWVKGQAFGTRLEHPISIDQIEKANQRRNALVNCVSAWEVEDRYVAPPPQQPLYRECRV